MRCLDSLAYRDQPCQTHALLSTIPYLDLDKLYADRVYSSPSSFSEGGTEKLQNHLLNVELESESG